ncbi:Pathogenesis-related homeodomain protein [Senna tora]|uniref:Pathogenesis-related homeodomain protein n=1 Tax=Senna tora TaxID=362788 RepID=A0A834W2B8_9FABA|nr:Pathogenesis-related homeodomain protein [Senna tora]
MRDSQKNLNNRGSRKSSHSKALTGLKPCSSLKFKTSSPISQGKRHKLKSKSNARRVGASISRTITDSSNKDSPKKKLIIRQRFHKTNGKSSQKLTSSKLQGEQNSHSSGDEAKELDEERRIRYLLIKMKLEQNLIDAYSAEGWKGQSREKIRPEKELLRAQKKILQCKLSIRETIHQLDSLSSVGSIEGSVIAPDGSVYHEHIFCAKCKLREAFQDNDIILCDGTCNRAFHQKCLDPPLETENIPPGDQGWFCKFCECKMEILEVINAHLGTHFSLDSTWQDVFKEEASIPDSDTRLLNQEEEWPSDDSDDDDYNPEGREDSHNIGTEGIDDNASDGLSSSSSLWASDVECSPGKEGVEHEFVSVNSCQDSDGSGEIACGRRRRKAVDYQKLYYEMFGKDAPSFEQVSEDEDWGPGKRKRREKESEAVNTLMTLHESDNKYPNDEQNNAREVSPGIQIRRPCFRLPRYAVEKLRQAFADNELPSKSVKDDLSKELGLDADKVSKWFKNARYLALKTRKQQAEGAEQLPSIPSGSPKDSSVQNLEKEHLTSKETSKVTVTRPEKNAKNVIHRKRIRSSSHNSLKNRKQEISPPHSRENVNKDLVEFADDVCLKKLLKEKKMRKRVSYMFEGDSHTAELEFEKLSKIKSRIDNMKQKLLQIQNYRAKDSDKPKSNEQSVIYVPVVELREKS